MTWFEKIIPSRIKTERRTRSVPEGLWIKCEACDAVLYRAELERNLGVCPKCSHHMRIDARERLKRFLDAGSASELATRIQPEDPLKFRDSKKYKDRLVAAQKGTGETDALIVMDDNLVEHASAGILAAGVRVPEQLDVVAHCNFPWPAPSVLPVARLGYRAAEVLDRCVDWINARREGRPLHADAFAGDAHAVQRVAPVFDFELD